MRRVLTLLLGVLTAFIVTFAIELMNQLLYTLPPELDHRRPEDLQKMIDLMPFGAALIVLLAWSVGTGCGAYVAVRLGPGRKFWPAWVIGGIQLLAGISMLLIARHPVWFSVVGVLEFLPSAMLGGKLAQPRADGPR